MSASLTSCWWKPRLWAYSNKCWSWSGSPNCQPCKSQVGRGRAAAMRNYQAVARVPLSGWLDRWLLDFIFKRWGSFLAKRSNFGFFGFVVHGLQWRRVTAAKESLSFTFVAGIKGSGDCTISNIHPSTSVRDGSYGLESGRGKSVLKWRLPRPRSRSGREAATSRRWRGSASVLGPGGGGRVGAATHGRTCGECR